MTTAITPTQAIRSAIRALQYERSKILRNQQTAQTVAAAVEVLDVKPVAPRNEDAEIIAQIDEEIAALESAIKQLQQFDLLRGILKSVVSE